MLGGGLEPESDPGGPPVAAAGPLVHTGPHSALPPAHALSELQGYYPRGRAEPRTWPSPTGPGVWVGWTLGGGGGACVR